MATVPDDGLKIAVRRSLEESIRTSARPHEAIASERRIAEQYGVSRTTARQAVDGLVAAGLLYRLKGSGTYVSEGGLVEKPLTVASFTEDMEARGLRPSSRLVELSTCHGRDDLAIAEALNLRPADEVTLIRRVRLADDTPMAYEFVALPTARVPDVASLDLSASLYAALQREYGVRIERIQQRVRAVSLTAEEAHHLATDTGSTALHFVRVGYDRRGAPVERAVTLYRGDRYELTMDASRGNGL